MRWNTATVSESAQWRSSKTIAARRPSRISPTSWRGHVEPGVERAPGPRPSGAARRPARRRCGGGRGGRRAAARRGGRGRRGRPGRPGPGCPSGRSARNSRTRRVLPTPASPPTSAMPGRGPREERAELLELLAPAHHHRAEAGTPQEHAGSVPAGPERGSAHGLLRWWCRVRPPRGAGPGGRCRGLGADGRGCGPHDSPDRPPPKPADRRVPQQRAAVVVHQGLSQLLGHHRSLLVMSARPPSRAVRRSCASEPPRHIGRPTYLSGR